MAINIQRAGIIAGLLAGLALLPACSKTPPPEPADLALIRGVILTIDAQDTIAEAIAVRGGRIVAVGTNGEIDPYIGDDTRVIDLRGRATTPGLIDTHNHFAWGAADALFRLDLVYPAVESIADVVELVEFSTLEKDDGEWIVGNGWDQGKFTEGRNLRASDLDPVSPDHPVWLGHTSGHYAVVNSKAMELAGIDRDTPDPAGGYIEREENGDPTGILTDQAQDLLYNVMPEYTTDHFAEAVARMAPELSAEGITTIKDPEIHPAFWEGYSRARADDALPVRVFALWRSPDTLEEAQRLLERIGASSKPRDSAHDDHLISGGVKIYIDGSGTVRTAWMHEDWNRNFDQTDAGNTGFPVVAPDVLAAQIRLFHEAGLHMGVHAIGDRAIDFVVDTYDKVLAETPTTGLRHSIIHCNIPSDHAIETMARLQRDFDAAIPEVQPGFTWWIADAYAANFGRTRNQRMIPLRTFMERGIRWSASSDYNVTPFPPRFGLWASVSREALLGTWGKHPFGSEESIDIRDALRAYTIWNAHQVFMEDDIGSLEVGKYADLVVWDRNPYEIPAEALKDMQAQITVLGGDVVFQRDSASPQ